MIAFMFIISLAIVAVFLYILTIQKLPNYAVLRAQGVPAKTLIWATVSQSLLLVTSALVLALLASGARRPRYRHLFRWPLRQGFSWRRSAGCC